MKTIRIYGEFSGASSLAQVANGFAQAFPEAIRYDLGAWGNDLDDSAPQVPGADSEVGIFVGGLNHLSVVRRTLHKKLWVMVTPNSDTIGAHLVGSLQEFDHLITPSSWARGVLRKIFPSKTVLCVPHGVDPQFAPRPGFRAEGEYRVLHLSSTTLERKGTRELLEAWKIANIPEGKLLISVPKGMLYTFQDLAESLEIQNSVFFIDRLGLSPEHMSRVYQSVDVVCQPSRGEGFGLVPLEARCSGTPVIMTDCTGHSQHVAGQGVVVIKTGDDAPIDDFPGAMAPSLRAEDISEALVKAHLEREKLSSAAGMAAKRLRKQWSWESQLKEFAKCL